MDSNHRSWKAADLQSAPFGHSGTHPCLNHQFNELTFSLPFFLSKTKTSQNVFVLRAEASVALLRLRNLRDPIAVGEDEPLVGLEPTTAWLQIECSTNWAKEAIVSAARLTFGAKADAKVQHFFHSRKLFPQKPPDNLQIWQICYLVLTFLHNATGLLHQTPIIFTADTLLYARAIIH